MKNDLLLGAEAIACGAIDAGISGVYAYPGTPSTEITEFIQNSPETKERKIRCSWAANEKTAYEAALGMSYAGKRSIVCMKHVGLNVAADAFMNSAMTGVKGGLVVVVADDPSMHSSQNEQDTRYYARFAMLPLIEPATQQEAYDAVIYALDYSEEIQVPVMIRIVTRLSHSRAVISRRPSREPNDLSLDTQAGKWILLPAIARRRYALLIEKQAVMEAHSANSPFFRKPISQSKKGILAMGISYNYAMEVIVANNLDIAVMKISQYPLPHDIVAEFIEGCDEVLIAEEGYPIYEESIRGFFGNNKIKGRLDGTLPRMGELSPDALAVALGVEYSVKLHTDDWVVGRPPALCVGCGHRDTYAALNEALSIYEDRHVFGDIGCYTLGALPPFGAIKTCVDMGASLTMAKGAAEAGLHPAIGIIGDSTFTHSGMTGLLDAANDKVRMTLIISDNSTTAMTGGQDSAGTNKLVQICNALGVEKEHIRIIIPLPKHHEDNVKILREEIEYNGVSVIIAQRECVQTAARKAKEAARLKSNKE
ncbi:MAG: thiamine pyrophosphate-dependent enzyme [Muribaculaceae bacterium]|nr:thiamine pyrophosphate-dependent enzyme [Muribaculaceae bacterium]